MIGGCSDDESTPAAGGQGGTATGGSKATGGSAGQTGGTGGTGTGGKMGTGGSGNAPTGGKAGAAGTGATGGTSTGGDTGTGGISGDAGNGSGGEPGGDGGGGSGGSGDQCITLTSLEHTLLSALGPLPTVPADPTNQYADNAAAATLGQRFFFDKAFSGALAIDSDLGTTGQTGKVACSSCHLGQMMEDDRSMPPQVSRAANVHARNAPGMVNSSFYVWTNWAGRFSAQWELPLPVAESPVIMNGTRLAIAHRIAAKYRADYEPIFGTLDAELGTTSTRFPASGKPNATTPGAWEGMASADRDIVMRVFVNFGKSLQAYTRKLVSRNSPFDQWMAGDCEAVSESAQRGAQLFVGKARCVSCHSNSHFSDDGFHNLGVAQGVPPMPDQGRFADAASLIGASAINSANATLSDSPTVGAARLAGLTNPMPESTRGAFRTPDLRGVAETGPYMHSGQLATLEDVVNFYDAGGGTPVTGTRDPLIVPLGLTITEKADLVAFLRTLTGQAVPAGLLTDTSAAP